MNLLTWVKDLYSNPTIESVMRTELRVAKLALLEAESGKEFAETSVDYNTRRVARLELRLKETSNG